MPTAVPSPYLFANPPVPGMRAADHLARWPAHILRARQPSFYGRGEGYLSIKTFLNGFARYETGDGGHYRVDEDSYLVLNHGQTYAITIDSPVPVESFCLFFSEQMAADALHMLTSSDDVLLGDPYGTGDAPRFFERTYSHDDILAPRLFALRTHVLALPTGVTPDPLWVTEQLQDMLYGLLAGQRRVRREVLACIDIAARPAIRTELYHRLYRARDFAAASLDQPLTIEAMASVACLSPGHFLRTFKAAFHCTPHQFLTQCRVRAARQLLEQTDVSITDICLNVGFASLGSFSHLFRRRVGISPEAYRHRFRSEK